MSYNHLRLPIAKATSALLEGAGFKRKGSSFTKTSDGWIEHYVIKGNRWNSGELPWLFYVDVGLEIIGMPKKAGAKDLWKHCHAVGSMSALCETLPRDFEASPDTVPLAGINTAEAIKRLSESLVGHIESVRARAAQGLLSPLPVPSTWLAANAA